MSVMQYLNRNYVPNFRIITFRNWKTEILYDSTKTIYDMPNVLYDSIVENVYDSDNGIIDIEI